MGEPNRTQKQEMCVSGNAKRVRFYNNQTKQVRMGNKWC